MSEPVIIRLKEAAKIIGISQSHVRNMIKGGLFQSAKRLSAKPASHWVLDLEEVEKAGKLYRELRKIPRPGRKPLYMQETVD